jgi:uncharacterized membrane protein YccC
MSYIPIPSPTTACLTIIAVYPSVAPEFTLGGNEARFSQYLIYCVVCCLLLFYFFVFVHYYMISSSSIYGYLLSLLASNIFLH